MAACRGRRATRSPWRAGSPAGRSARRASRQPAQRVADPRHLDCISRGDVVHAQQMGAFEDRRERRGRGRARAARRSAASSRRPRKLLRERPTSSGRPRACSAGSPASRASRFWVGVFREPDARVEDDRLSRHPGAHGVCQTFGQRVADLADDVGAGSGRPAASFGGVAPHVHQHQAGARRARPAAAMPDQPRAVTSLTISAPASRAAAATAALEVSTESGTPPRARVVRPRAPRARAPLRPRPARRRAGSTRRRRRADSRPSPPARGRAPPPRPARRGVPRPRTSRA